MRHRTIREIQIFKVLKFFHVGSHFNSRAYLTSAFQNLNDKESSLFKQSFAIQILVILMNFLQKNFFTDFCLLF